MLYISHFFTKSAAQHQSENHRLTSNALVVKHAAAIKNIQAYL